MIDAERALARAEDFLRRHLKSREAREAEKRRRARMWREAGIRMGRAAMLTGASVAGVVGYGVAVAPVGVGGLVAAGAATLAGAVGMLMLPAGRRPAATPSQLADRDLKTIAEDVEDWLVQQRGTLPGRAAPAIDTILGRLHEIGPQLAPVDPASPLAGEARRLIGQYLPRLVETYQAVPAAVRSQQPEVERQLFEGLGIVANELTRLAVDLGRDRLNAFQTEGRFLESRYRDDQPFG